jgi:hypothetical protein
VGGRRFRECDFVRRTIEDERAEAFVAPLRAVRLFELRPGDSSVISANRDFERPASRLAALTREKERATGLAAVIRFGHAEKMACGRQRIGSGKKPVTPRQIAGEGALVIADEIDEIAPVDEKANAEAAEWVMGYELHLENVHAAKLPTTSCPSAPRACASKVPTWPEPPGITMRTGDGYGAATMT